MRLTWSARTSPSTSALVSTPCGQATGVPGGSETPAAGSDSTPRASTGRLMLTSLIWSDFSCATGSSPEEGQPRNRRNTRKKDRKGRRIGKGTIESTYQMAAFASFPSFVFFFRLFSVYSVYSVVCPLFFQWLLVGERPGHLFGAPAAIRGVVAGKCLQQSGGGQHLLELLDTGDEELVEDVEHLLIEFLHALQHRVASALDQLIAQPRQQELIVVRLR